MKYYLPTKIFYGKNALSDAKSIIQNLGKKALIVTGKSSAEKSGALDDVKSCLESLKIDFYHYDEITENPSLVSVTQGVQHCREEACDFVIGIGGGSPIDAGKAISIIVGSNIAVSDVYNSSKFSKALPLLAVPITSGTGTEATQYSVLTDTEKQTKAGFGSELTFPTISILNPEYTYTLPEHVTINTAIDALSHLLEGIYSKNRNTLTYPLIFKGVKLIIDNLKGAILHPNNYENRDALMQASLYGGIVIAQSGTTLQHSIGYPLTTKFATPHGRANGIVMKEMMQLNYPALKDDIDSLFNYLGISLTDFYTWLDKFDLNLNDKLDEDLIHFMSVKVMETRNMASNPVSVTLEDVKNLYRKISK